MIHTHTQTFSLTYKRKLEEAGGDENESKKKNFWPKRYPIKHHYDFSTVLLFLLYVPFFGKVIKSSLNPYLFNFKHKFWQFSCKMPNFYTSASLSKNSIFLRCQSVNEYQTKSKPNILVRSVPKYFAWFCWLILFLGPAIDFHMSY